MLIRRVFFAAVSLSVLLCAVAGALGQSTDQSLPTPVDSNEINGTIDPLDLGDPRLTRHYYAFEGTPGDVLITVDSKNLNGDIDIFTAVTYRPLAKASMYADSQSQAITKDIYLRTRQIMILRVEARTPNDEAGSYHIQFSGTFAQFSGGIPVAKESTAAMSVPKKSGNNQLTSVGATIPRPPTEPVETVTTTPTPEKTPEATASPKPAQKPATTGRRTTSRRGARPGTAKSTPPRKKEPAKTDTAKSKPADASATSNATPPTDSQVVQPADPHLIVEQKDGTRIDRPMSTVRRVIVEGPAIVVVLKTGQIQRIPMANVIRMTIEPQQ